MSILQMLNESGIVDRPLVEGFKPSKTIKVATTELKTFIDNGGEDFIEISNKAQKEVDALVSAFVSGIVSVTKMKHVKTKGFDVSFTVANFHFELEINHNKLRLLDNVFDHEQVLECFKMHYVPMTEAAHRTFRKGSVRQIKETSFQENGTKINLAITRLFQFIVDYNGQFSGLISALTRLHKAKTNVKNKHGIDVSAKIISQKLFIGEMHFFEMLVGLQRKNIALIPRSRAEMSKIGMKSKELLEYFGNIINSGDIHPSIAVNADLGTWGKMNKNQKTLLPVTVVNRESAESVSSLKITSNQGEHVFVDVRATPTKDLKYLNALGGQVTIANKSYPIVGAKFAHKNVAVKQKQMFLWLLYFTDAFSDFFKLVDIKL